MSILGQKCPGQSTMFWRPEDVHELPCPHCGYSIEFFKIDLKRKCPKCRHEVLNPKANFSCAEWCEHAEDCLGPDIYGQLAEKRELNRKREADFTVLLDSVPEHDTEVKAIFEKLFHENTDSDSLLHVDSLRRLRAKEPELVERAMKYYRRFVSRLT